MHWIPLLLFIDFSRPMEFCMKMMPPEDVGYTTEEPMGLTTLTSFTEATTEPLVILF